MTDQQDGRVLWRRNDVTGIRSVTDALRTEVDAWEHVSTSTAYY